MFLHGEALHRMDLDGGNHRRVVSGVGRVVSDGGRGGTGPGLGVLLDYHYTQRSLFWAERSTGVLYRAGLSGPPRQVRYTDYILLLLLYIIWYYYVVIVMLTDRFS